MAGRAQQLAIGPETIVADKYRVTRLIKTGGMGEVYEAKHLRLGRRVAIKVLRSALLQDQTHQARFDREACIAGGIEHEHVAAIFDIGKDEQGAPFIVMEYLEGETLRAIIETRAPLPVPRAVSMVLQICTGLSAAHARGIIHRDLKPENLMVCQRTDGRDWIKILDFGIARLSDDKSQPDVTTTGVVLGTAHYMSPEQARGEEIDARTDVHAVGAILYELLSGQKAHPGDSYNTVIYHLLSKELISLGSVRAGLPDQLVDAVHRALAHAPKDRFASVKDLARAIEPLAESGQTSPLLETTSAYAALPMTSSRPLWIASATLFVVVLVAAFLGLRTSDDGSRTEPATPHNSVAAHPPTPAAPVTAASLPAVPAQPAAPQPIAAQPQTTAAQAMTASATAAPARSNAPQPSKPRTAAVRKPAAGAVPAPAASPPVLPEGFVDNPYGR